jgi:hypothetical protein
MRILTKIQALQRDAIGLPTDGFTIVDQLPDDPPPEPASIPRLQQLQQRLACGLLTEAEHVELKKLREPAEKEAARDWEFQQISHQSAAGLITEAQFLAKRDQLVEKFEREPSMGKRRLLTEQQQQCPDDCDCDDCHKAYFRRVLDHACANGRCSIEKAREIFENRFN